MSNETKSLASVERATLGGAGFTSEMAIRRVSSSELLGPRGELIIQHHGREYRLRLTQNGKLILTA